MQIAVLGPFEVREGDTVIDVAGSRLRRLLIRLVLDAGRPVSAPALVDAVWDDAPPADAGNALQSLVSRLRRTLGDAASIAQSPAGYRLAIDPGDVDANRFERLAQEGASALRAGEHMRAVSALRAAQALWRGPALPDVADAPFAVAALTRLEDLRLAATHDRIDAELVMGHAAGLIAELDAMAEAHPLDERVAAARMRALAAVGRQADALAGYERIRRRLADELGVDPSPQLRDVHLAVLRGDASPVAPGSRRTNLRAQLTSFVGRHDELARIGKLLQESRLVSLVGPGGAGKTRLAVEAGAALVDDVRDGIWFVGLASVTDPADVPQAVLGSLGLRESHILEQPAKLTPRDATSRLVEALSGRAVVVVLDNCEHLIDATAQLADQLLAECEGLRILTTSREPLGIFGESLIVVPPLGQPAPDAPLQEALEYPAVRLFGDRGAAVRPDFRLADANVATVIEIVRRLDGLPLAIELAAARLRSLPVEEIAARLSDRFRLLTGGSRTALPRHRTLRAVVQWSWDLLPAPERRLVERLAAFPAGATPESAEAVCADADVPAADVLNLLASLVDKSLLQEVGHSDVRYRMLETIREYGLERLAGRGELLGVRDAHASYFAELVQVADAHLRRPEQLQWMARLDAERDNILAALRHLGDEGRAQQALETAVAMGWYWSLIGNHAEALTWISFVLAVPGESDPDLRLMAEAIQVINTAVSPVALPFDEVEAGIERIAEIAGRLEQVDVERIPLIGLLKPVMAMFADDLPRVETLVEEALSNPDPWVRAAVRSFRAGLAENNGDVARMRVEAERAVAEFRVLGERWGLANSLQMLAQLNTVSGHLDAAAACYEEALTLVREMRAHEDQALMQVRLAELRMRQGDLAAARVEVERARELSEHSGMLMDSLFAGAVLAECARLSGDWADARRLRDEALERLQRIPQAHPIQGHARALILAIAAKHDITDGAVGTGRVHLEQAYAAAIGTRDMPIAASVGVVAADLAMRLDQPLDAAELLGAAAGLRGANDATQLDIRRITETLRRLLGESAFAAAFERGRGLHRDAALARLDPALLTGDDQARLR